ncbi:MAG: hypothetical protein KAU20_05475 [Nanoarchaeota archaeon]|nr:hypothetical protein [Nanoarchaeota archaeon]
MTEEQLKLEIGSEAFLDLTPDEVAHFISEYSDIKLAGMKVFELLWKKFKPTYRMGKLYEKESDRYKAYKEIFLQYVKQLSVGIHTGSSQANIIERSKWSE